MNNKTENKHTPDESFTSDNLVSEMRQVLCQSNIDRCSQGPTGPPGPPAREEREATEDEGETKKKLETKETTVLWDRQGEVESKASWDRQGQREKLD